MLYIHSIIIIIAFVLAAIILVFYTSFQKEKGIFEKFENTTLEKDETFSMTFSEFLSKYNIKSKEELKMISPRVLISFNTFFNLSSKSPR